MNGIKVLLDTNIIIGLVKQNESVIARLKERQFNLSDCAYSAITRMELLGFPSITLDETHAIKTLLDDIHYYPIDRALEDQAIQIRQSIKIKLPDAIIAATAILHDIALMTLDAELIDKWSRITNVNPTA